MKKTEALYFLYTQIWLGRSSETGSPVAATQFLSELFYFRHGIDDDSPMLKGLSDAAKNEIKEIDSLLSGWRPDLALVSMRFIDFLDTVEKFNPFEYGYFAAVERKAETIAKADGRDEVRVIDVFRVILAYPTPRIIRYLEIPDGYKDEVVGEFVSRDMDDLCRYENDRLIVEDEGRETSGDDPFDAVAALEELFDDDDDDFNAGIRNIIFDDMVLSDAVRTIYARARKNNGLGVHASVIAAQFLVEEIKLGGELHSGKELGEYEKRMLDELDEADKIYEKWHEGDLFSPFTSLFLKRYAADRSKDEVEKEYFSDVEQAAYDLAHGDERKIVTVSDFLRVLFSYPLPIVRERFNVPDDYCDENVSFFPTEAYLKIMRESGKDTDEPRKSETAKRAPEPKKTFPELVLETQKIRDFLLSEVLDQEKAIEVFSSGFFQASAARLAGKKSGKPLATFLFAGPPGVGKTFLAEKVAEVLKLPYMRFDMSEYSDDEANIEFAGSDKVYKNGSEGNVTGFVAANPRSVLLFDEIEKAHLNVIHLFLQILDAGRLRDNFTDEEVDFTDTVIIFTTNAGKNVYSDPSIVNLSSLSRKQILKALSTDLNPLTGKPLFPAAICSRFGSGNVVMFNRLEATNLLKIASAELGANMLAFNASTSISVKIDEKIPAAILFSEGGNADGRTVKGRAASFFHEEIFELFRLLMSEKNKADVNGIETLGILADTEGMSPNIAELFENPDVHEILLFTDDETAKVFNSKVSGIKVFSSCDFAEAKDHILENEPALAVVDVSFGERADTDALNAEDLDSVGIDLVEFILGSTSTPVYLLAREDGEISSEEMLSFFQKGVCGVFVTSAEDSSLSDEVAKACDRVYRKDRLAALARENKILTYKSRQTISEDKKHAKIILFGFSVVVAPDAEDMSNVLSAAAKPTVRFSDVIGAEDAKEELGYFVSYLKDPVKYMKRGASAPKGVLLYGPPGTGKTLLAKAMAGESDVTFIPAEGNRFLKSKLGEGVEEVHKLFASARKYAPAIIFIDEIDAIARPRETETGKYTSDILTAFLTELDGFVKDVKKPVFLLAATNMDPEKGGMLDPALMRRFDRKIYVDLPTRDERERFIRKMKDENDLLAMDDETIKNVALRSTGMSLSELGSVISLAIRNAVRAGKDEVDGRSFEEAFETIVGGESKIWSERSILRTARHEAGHALIMWLCGEKPSYITVISRGDHGGYVQGGDGETRAVATKKEMLALIRTALAGRAAELVYYGEEDGVSTGASEDIAKATAAAEAMICRYGMDPSMGIASVDPDKLGDAGKAELRRRVNEILKEQLAAAIWAISENKAAIDKMTEVLVRENHLKGSEIDAVFSEMVER